MEQVVLDTDILSAIMRQDSVVMPKAREYLTKHKQFSFSIMTRYEILRGLKAKKAIRQTKAFDNFCAANIVLPMTDEIVVRAADIYADLRTKGEIIGDADILIAASALVQELKVITNNERHFQRIHGLTVENWLKSF